MSDINHRISKLSELSENICPDLLPEMFSSPLKVSLSSGKTEMLELDKSEDPILINNDGIPVAVVKLSNGNGAKLRFDVNPPRLSGFDYKENRFLVDTSEFILLTKAARAGMSIESFIFLELFRPPLKVFSPKTKVIKFIPVKSVFLYDVNSIPVGLVEVESNKYLTIRFDVSPPELCSLNTKEGIQIDDKSVFVHLVANAVS